MVAPIEIGGGTDMQCQRFCSRTAQIIAQTGSEGGPDQTKDNGADDRECGDQGFPVLQKSNGFQAERRKGRVAPQKSDQEEMAEEWMLLESASHGICGGDPDEKRPTDIAHHRSQGEGRFAGKPPGYRQAEEVATASSESAPDKYCNQMRGHGRKRCYS